MGKLSRKLLIYLDQNFLSEMAKADGDARINPQFTSIYDILRNGFVNEKCTVARSFFHDLETSLAPQFRKRVQSYQGHLGQTSLRDRFSIQLKELYRAINDFVGTASEPQTWTIISDEDPDRRVEPFDIRLNLNLDVFDFANSRNLATQHLASLQTRVRADRLSLSTQIAREKEEHITYLPPEQRLAITHHLSGDANQVSAFLRSAHFHLVPSFDVASMLWARLLIDAQRDVRPSDYTDVQIASTYLPYIDVFATDTFLATMLRELRLDTRYRTAVFGASREELRRFEAYLREVLSKLSPVSWPDLTVFVVSDDRIKRHSWAFFQRLCSLARRCEWRKRGWMEIVAVDDGTMPSYPDERIGGAWPFYGPQEVRVVKFADTSNNDSLLAMCRRECRTERFALVDTLIELPDTFAESMIASSRAGNSIANGIALHDARSTT